LLVADRLRAVLNPLVEAGNLVVIQAPGIDSAEGEAIVGSADMGLVVVTMERTRPRQVQQVLREARTRGVALSALVVGPAGSRRRRLRPAKRSTRPQPFDSKTTQEEAASKGSLIRTRR
jgi:hypothetical protein